ncbi:MAG: hypothetical protein O3C61_04995 [Proteobacteria bacterium]|nr:hypothetical protein [Pseudomonadota bacterium]
MWFNLKHLREAEKHSGNSNTNPIILYFKHMRVSFREAWSLLLLAIASLLHGICLPLFDFKLLELRLKYDEKLYDFIPTHHAWESLRKKIEKK